MNTKLTKSIQDRFAELLAEREQFVVNANQKLSEYAGRLAELEEVFKQLTPVEDDEQNEQIKAGSALQYP